MISKGLIERVFDAASIQRWNDHVRPVDLTELDKQAHKLVIAYIIAKHETDQLTLRDWLKLIEGSLFEFLQRVVLTDIKPPVFHRLLKSKKKELNDFVFAKLRPDMDCLKNDLFHRFCNYLRSSDTSDRVRRILKASHYLATNWEFKIIYHSWPVMYGIERTKLAIESEIEDYIDFAGVQKINLNKKSHGFIDLCGQLRFQKRWAQTPRVPQTSVLGHMLVVSYLAYLCTNEIQGSSQRMYNNTFAALFHDLPEVLTRDIISPVKSSVEGLKEEIEEIELELFEREIIPLLPLAARSEIRAFLEPDKRDKNRFWKERDGTYVTVDAITVAHATDQFFPIDGELIKACDSLAAVIEASKSMEHGIKSHHLEEGMAYLSDKYEGAEIAGVDFGRMFRYFA